MARFIRTVPAPEVKGDYTRFRPYVRNDFERCCAYCYLHEYHYPRREDSFQLDHFRPRDPRLFPDLVNDFYNIYYACEGCNRYKSNYWPTAEELSLGEYFVDLCAEDFEKHYVLLPDGKLDPQTKAAEYTILRIRLNSEALKGFRRDRLKEGKQLDKEPV